MRVYSILVSCLVAISAHATERIFVPVPTEGQQVRYANGAAYLATQTSSAALQIAYVPNDSKSALLFVGVTNLSQASFNFTETSITASSNGTPLPVMSYRDRIAELKRQERWSSIGAAFAMAANNMNANNAGHESSYGTYSGTATASAYGPAGTVRATANSTGTYYGSNYNATAAEMAKENANAQNQALAQQQQANIDYAHKSLEDRALKANTIDPSQSLAGDVKFSLPKRDKSKPAEFSAVVDLAGQPVTVLFREQQ